MPRVTTRTMSFEKALRIFRKKVELAGIKDELRTREYYEKPNQKRRQKINSAKRRNEREKLRVANEWKAYKLKHGRNAKL